MTRLHALVIAACITPLLWSGCGKKSSGVAENPDVLPTPQSDSDPIGVGDNDAESSNTSPQNGEPGESAAPSPESSNSEAADVASDIAEEAADIAGLPEQGVSTQPESETTMVSADATEVDEMMGAATEPESMVDPPQLRVLLPTTAGLVLLDVDVRVGGVPLAEAFADQVDQILSELTESQNPWKAFLDLVGSDPTRFGRSMFESQQTNNVVRLFDNNRNGKPDPPEAARVLFRRSQTDQPFRIDGTDSFRTINRTQSSLLRTLDRNGDRVVDASEIERCLESVIRLDQNGDGRIARQEVVMVPDNDPAWNRRRSTRWGDVAMDLTGYIDWNMLADNLELTGRFAAFGSDENLLSRTDANSDGSIDEDEAKHLLDCEADIRLRVEFPLTGTQTPNVEVVRVSESLQSRVRIDESPGRVWITSDSLELLVCVNDLLGRPDLIPSQAFEVLDADKDGALDESEIPDAALREYSFDDLDLDADGKLTIDEVQRATAQQSSIWCVQVRGRAAESRDAMFDWLDRNHDQMLSARELRDLPTQLAERASEEGTLRPDLIPDSFQLVMGRGDPDRNDQLFTIGAPNDPQSESRPRWAQAMDSNGDGDIDLQEFIGTKAQFQSLDQDDDGFIDTIEAGGSMGSPEPLNSASEEPQSDPPQDVPETAASFSSSSLLDEEDQTEPDVPEPNTTENANPPTGA